MQFQDQEKVQGDEKIEAGFTPREVAFSFDWCQSHGSRVQMLGDRSTRKIADL